MEYRRKLTEYEIIDKVLYIKEGTEYVDALELRNVEIDKVVIPDSVKIIGSFAFYKIGVKEVQLGSGVESIGNFAFASNYIEKIEFPDGLNEIGAEAFQDNNLESVEFPDSVEHIYQGAFESNKLTSVKLPPNLRILEPSVFRRNRLTNVDLNEKLTNIEGEAFAYNRIENIDLKNVYVIGKEAFIGNRISQIELPYDLKKIEKGVFARNRLTSVVIPETIKKIGFRAFAFNNLESVEFGDNVTFIGEEAFMENKIESLDLPDGLLKIGERAFMDNAIKGLELPEELEEIDPGAFLNNKIEDLKINDALEYIGVEAFGGNKLKYLEIGTKFVDRLAFTNNPLDLVVITNNNTNIRNDVFSTREIQVGDVRINNDILTKFDTINLDKILAFKKAVGDYDIMKVDKFELSSMPIDKDVFKQYKANHKKYMAMLDELGVRNNAVYFRLAHLLGLFNNQTENVKDFILYLERITSYDLVRLMDSYKITKPNKKLTNVAKEFINDADNLQIFATVLRNHKDLFEKILVYKKDQIAKMNTMKLRLTEDGQDTTEINKELQQLKKNLKNVTFDEIIDYYQSTAFEIKPENERLKEVSLVLSSYVNNKEFDDIQRIYKRRTREDELYFKNFSGKHESLEYSWLSSDDPTNLILGYLVDCCAKFKGAGQDIMVQSIVNPRIKNLVIKKDGKIIAKTTVFYNEDYMICNNVEVKRGILFKEEILDILVKALKEQADYLGVSKVNIGLSNNDLLGLFKSGDFEITRHDLLDNYGYSGYIGDAFYEQVKILK